MNDDCRLLICFSLFSVEYDLVAPHYYKSKDLEDDSKKKMPKGQGMARIEPPR